MITYPQCSGRSADYSAKASCWLLSPTYFDKRDLVNELLETTLLRAEANYPLIGQEE